MRPKMPEKISLYRAAVMLAALVLFAAAYFREHTGISLEWLSFGGVCLLLLWFYLGGKLPKKRR